MTRDSHGPNDDFAARVRDRIQHPAATARSLIARLRELMHPHGHPAGTPSHASGAPRHGDEPWPPRKHSAPQNTPRPAPLTFRDEEGDVTELPLEFATATMGHLLLDQGRPDDARRVFRAVLARNPGDTEALRGLSRLGDPPESIEDADVLADSIPDAPGVRDTEPEGMLDRAPPPAAYGVSEARALPVDPVSIVVFWELTDADLEHAGAMGAAPALSVTSHTPDATGVHRSERIIEGIPQVGDWFVTGLPAGAMHHAAVGFLRNGVVIPVVHAEPVSTPRGRPAAAPARVRATVALPHDDTGEHGTYAEGAYGPRITGIAGPGDALHGREYTVGVSVNVVITADGEDTEVFDHFHQSWVGAQSPSSQGFVSVGGSTSSR